MVISHLGHLTRVIPSLSYWNVWDLPLSVFWAYVHYVEQ